MITPRQTLKPASALAAGAVASVPGKHVKKPGSNHPSKANQDVESGLVAPKSDEGGSRTTDHELPALDALLDRLIKFFASLRLTVICLALGLLLVFAGTIAQVD